MRYLPVLVIGVVTVLRRGFMDSFFVFLSQAECLVSTFFPQKIEEMEKVLQTSFSLEDLTLLKAPLDIPVPDPAKEELKRKNKEEEAAKKGKKDKEKEDDEDDEGPPCGPVASNDKVEHLIKLVKPDLQTLKEKLNAVSMWVQLQIPKIEDGNNFGVAVQEKVFEFLTNTRTKIEGFQAQITKYYSERGDAVAKACKQPHVGDYRQLVHELDQHQYRELRFMALEIRNTYAVLHDIIGKNYDKITKPRGDSKALIY
uniref:Proteasome activator complex subunit 1 n=1 Tax=Scleropages formosus TaxID=113540 RepID=A0A8C9SJ75_SCLFO